MKTGFTIRTVLIIGLLCTFELLSAPFDTGITTFYQPNNVSFVGRIWGDEFLWWAETETGHRFIQRSDGWYYYATLDEQGEFTSTSYKVGIDSPPLISYLLDRTPERIQEIQNLILQFQEQLEINQELYQQKQDDADALGQPVKLKVGVVLIEFSDVEHFKTTEPPNTRPDGYLTADFDSMMFSYNYWYDTTGQTPHPENEKIFGSFRDYWDQISRGKLKIEGRVANPTDEATGVPKWLVANGTQSHYLDTVGAWIMALEAYEMALDSGYISTDPSNPNYFDHFIVVYARETRQGLGNVGGGGGANGNIVHLPERAGPFLYLGGPNEKTFTHIGVYAHEFGHSLGFLDEYKGSSNNNITDIYNFDLMAGGMYNGPLNKGECTATLSPYWRIQKKWVTPIPLTVDEVNLIVEYNYAEPKLYKLNPPVEPSITEEYYLLETKKRYGFDLYIPGPPSDTVNQPGRLLIWRHNISPLPPHSFGVDRILIKPADNYLNETSQLLDFFPANFQNSQNLDDMTIPAATLGYIFYQVPFTSNEGPAHFSLNGIQRLPNGDILIEEIKLNIAKFKNDILGNWQSLSVGAIVNDYLGTAVFPTAISPIYEYIPGHGYIQRDTLSNGPGYWVNFDSPQSLIQSGQVITSLDIPISKDWNIIGSISDKIPKPNICSSPNGIIISIFRYNSGYHLITNSDSLKPGIGYWVNSTSDGSITLLRNFNCPENEELNLSTMDKFIVTDSDGNSQDLFVTNIDIDTPMVHTNIALPPFFPELSFDSRFEHNEFIKCVSGDSGTIDLSILVHTNSYPVTLSWDLNPANGINYAFIQDSIQGKVSSIMNQSGNISYSILENNRIRLWASTDNLNPKVELPTEYLLQQNYPNPFNPTTVIRYELPQDGLVTIKVFDILGKEVTTLINENKSAGRYSINFDGGNLASGVYLYQLKSGDFISTKKMTLIK